MPEAGSGGILPAFEKPEVFYLRLTSGRTLLSNCILLYVSQGAIGQNIIEKNENRSDQTQLFNI